MSTQTISTNQPAKYAKVLGSRFLGKASHVLRTTISSYIKTSDDTAATTPIRTRASSEPAIHSDGVVENRANHRHSWTGGLGGILGFRKHHVSVTSLTPSVNSSAEPPRYIPSPDPRADGIREFCPAPVPLDTLEEIDVDTCLKQDQFEQDFMGNKSPSEISFTRAIQAYSTSGMMTRAQYEDLTSRHLEVVKDSSLEDKDRKNALKSAMHYADCALALGSVPVANILGKFYREVWFKNIALSEEIGRAHV